MIKAMVGAMGTQNWGVHSLEGSKQGPMGVPTNSAKRTVHWSNMSRKNSSGREATGARIKRHERLWQVRSWLGLAMRGRAERVECQGLRTGLLRELSGQDEGKTLA